MEGERAAKKAKRQVTVATFKKSQVELNYVHQIFSWLHCDIDRRVFCQKGLLQRFVVVQCMKLIQYEEFFKSFDRRIKQSKNK